MKTSSKHASAKALKVKRRKKTLTQPPSASNEDTLVESDSSGPLTHYYQNLRKHPVFTATQRELTKKRSSAKRRALRDGFLETNPNQFPTKPGDAPSSPPRPKAVFRSKPAKIPKSTRVDRELIPLLGTTRRARRTLLGTFSQSIGDKLFIDPFVAKELRRQEIAEPAYLEALIAILGKKANWRDSLVYEARREPDSYEELSWLLADAACRGDTDELRRFEEACLRIQNLLKRGRSQALKYGPSQLEATLFVTRMMEEKKRKPTRVEVEMYLERKGFPFPPSRTSKRRKSGSNSGRFYEGPFLSTLRQGRSWDAQKLRKSQRLPIKD
jgi:hypothetical protein